MSEILNQLSISQRVLPAFALRTKVQFLFCIITNCCQLNATLQYIYYRDKRNYHVVYLIY